MSIFYKNATCNVICEVLAFGHSGLIDIVHAILILTKSGSHSTQTLFYLATVYSLVKQKIKTTGRVSCTVYS
jgi:hypothetical protein